MNQRINLLKKLSDKKKIEILRKNWMSQDAKSQMAIVSEFGWEKGNKINKQVIGEMGKVMMYRFKNALDVKIIKNPDDLINLISTMVEFYYPPPNMVYEFEKISDCQILAIVKKCPIIEQVKSIGVSDFYECGCFEMRKGWYKALKLKAKEECLACIKQGESECKIMIDVSKWNE